jgi:hypothetical protein
MRIRRYLPMPEKPEDSEKRQRTGLFLRVGRGIRDSSSDDDKCGLA